MSPRRTASWTASARDVAPSLKNARFMNIFTVFSLRSIAAAISRLLAPFPARASTSHSRAESPFGPFRREGTILESDPAVATGAGHHSVIRGRGEDEYYIVYHRHPLGATDGNNRVVCIERLYFDDSGRILPVRITFEGVPASRL